ncbi:MAG: type II toxin-antitoxin system VapC family toxin [Bryobacteraceae bacterium]
MVLIDTDVLIECLRGSINAKEWLAALEDSAFAIPAVVAMELVMGCRNQSELQHMRKFLESVSIAWPEASEFELSYRLLLAYRLSSGLSIPDLLIAAVAISRKARLYTFNLKHFQVVDGLDAEPPYQRP